MAERFVAISSLALMLFSVPGKAADTPGPNLLGNPGFEKPLPEGGWAGIWDIRQELFNQGRLLVSPKYRHSGLNSLGLYPNKRNVVNSSFYDYGLIQRLPVDQVKGKSILYGAWMNAEDGAFAHLRMVAVGTDGSVVVRSIRMDPEPSTGKREMHLRQDVFDVPDVPLKEVFIFCSVQGTEGSAYFDDVFVGEANANTRVVQPSDTQGTIARISIDTTRTLRRIPEGLFGMNIEYAHGFYGTWNEFTKQFSGEMLDLTNGISPSTLRFPGGLFANFYHWRNGIGPTRPQALLLPERGDTINTFGTDEAIAFAKKTNSSLFVTANIYTGTSDEAVEWLRYFRDKEFPVKYWELGNEIYFLNDPNDPTGPFWSPEKYADTYLQFARALKAEDPEIKTAADIEFNFGMAGCGQIGATGCWTDVVLRRAGPEIDYIALHNALAPIILGRDAGWDARTVYEGMLAAPQFLDTMLNDLSRKVDALAGPGSERIRFAMVEYGPFFQVDPQNRFIDHVKTLAGALYTASLLKVLIENPRMEFAQGFSLFDPWTQGWIGLRNDTEHIAKAPYYAFMLFRKHFGNLLLPTHTDSPSYSARSIGIVPAVANVPYLDVVSSRDEETGEVKIIAVNKNLDRPMGAAFLLKGFSASGSAKIWTLNGTAPDANTGTQIPSTVPAGIYAPQTAYQPNGRLNEGGPTEVGVSESSIDVSGSCFYYEFPAHSVTAISISGSPAAVSLTPCEEPQPRLP